MSHCRCRSYIFIQWGLGVGGGGGVGCLLDDFPGNRDYRPGKLLRLTGIHLSRADLSHVAAFRVVLWIDNPDSLDLCQ